MLRKQNPSCVSAFRAQPCSIALYIIALQLGWMLKVSVCSRLTQTRGLPAECSMMLQQPTSIVTEDFLQDFLDVYLSLSVDGIFTLQVSSYYAYIMEEVFNNY